MQALVNEELVHSCVSILHIKLAGNFGEGTKKLCVSLRTAYGHGSHGMKYQLLKAVCACAVHLEASWTADCRGCTLQVGARRPLQRPAFTGFKLVNAPLVGGRERLGIPEDAVAAVIYSCLREVIPSVARASAQL